MRIGITVQFQFSFFSAGSPQTALSAAETYRLKGHEVTFINVGDVKEVTWWDDVKGVRSDWKIVHASDLPDNAEYDLCIEIGSHILKPAGRKAFKKCVWLSRKPMLYSDIESSLFPITHAQRNLDGVSEIWLLKEFTTSDDIQYAELLFRLPVRVLPYMWTSSAVEFHRQENKCPVWHQVSEMNEVKGKPWSIHICETNTSSASSCTVPLFIMREIKKKCDIPLSPMIKIHNADNIKQSQFFRYNILGHTFSDIQDMSGTFVGRQRIIDFVYDPMSIIVSHSRFMNIRAYLLDCIWVGIPLIHNSTVLKELGGYLAEGYYHDNCIREAKSAFERITKYAKGASVDELIAMRKKIIDRFTPFSESLSVEWNAAASEVGQGRMIFFEKVVAPTLSPIPVSASTAPSAALALAPANPQKKSLTVGFSDMWVGFNPEYNQFLLMMREMGKHLQSGERDVIGVDAKAVKEDMLDLVIFGPFGDDWKAISKTIPKIHYTGENTPPIEREDVRLNLGYEHRVFNDGSYLRLPLWMLEINWFQGDTERIGNPKPIPIDRCCKVNEKELYMKEKFCAFVVTNPCQPMRNSAFQWLNNYKNVDSAGRLFNNMGDKIFAGLGGGGGELKKLEFLKEYKFCLAYENASSPGYTTEKLLHAKAAGCIPIYWGDPRVERDFDTSGFIDARNVLTSGELVRLVKEVDTNYSEWMKMFRKPALDEVRRDQTRRTLAECAKRMWLLALKDEKEFSKAPSMIGYTEDLPLPLVKAIATETKTITPPLTKPKPVIEETIFITACNGKFLPSLQIMLQMLSQHSKNIRMIIYFMADIPVDVEQKFIETFPFTEIRRFPTEVPGDFQDLWAPEHFAWKIWLMKEAVNNSAFSGKIIFYMDAGATMVRWPQGWVSAVAEYGICVLEDPREFNKYRCHREFVKAMSLTTEELDANQIWAGSMAFVSGHTLASKILNEAWTWAQKRPVIVGAKWTGQNMDGHFIGHRHDQSILSVLCKRNKCAALPLDEIYCDVSLHNTYVKGKFLYVHRGMFKVHEPIVAGIDEAWVINLDRRADRLAKFKEGHKDLADRLMRLPAFEGTKLKLTPNIARLFKPHDFNWKKPVMGCALSHLAVWLQLSIERPEINTYLILEDDARLDPKWRQAWEKVEQEKAFPADWDVIYLGGILPPNRQGFEDMCVEMVNDYVGRVRKNSVFGQNPPNRYFHFCAYAYVLTKKGAQKILDVLKAKDGYWTSADHMICNIGEVLNIYFLHPLIAGCYQDEDPVYQKSLFNDFSRVDNFDSDLWNNKEHFSKEEVAKILDGAAPLDILGALEDARNSQISAPASVPAEKARVPEPMPESKPAPLVETSAKRRIISIGFKTDSSIWHEYAWLKQILFENAGISMNVEMLENDAPPPKDEPIVYIQRPHGENTRKTLMRWTAMGAKFYVLHVSDEYGTDPVDFYEWPSCLGVLRNYVRPDVQESDRVRILPLGFHWAITNGLPLARTPRPPFREYVWSFIGTGWNGRGAKLEALNSLPVEKRCVLQEDWNSPKMLGREETLSVMLNSWCIPCPAGQNSETYRFYEALEAGAVPILVKGDVTEVYLQYLQKWLPLLTADNWGHAAQLIFTLKNTPEVYEQYRNHILNAWENMKNDVRGFVKGVYRV